ncbi:hypothetical protein QBZ16_001984 [Prototheca wickerhamii]|uniref:Protein groES n=1 Tax=Prototheca wickerhamii TaxID=3111 RepID=A0AAD9MI45_PROWI|nr:hypothetical protein QBZ16_001984 [Prototheca wickerhamii]
MSAAKRLIPLLDRVLVEKIVAPTKTAGGILLPESSAAKINQGTVLAVGPGRRSLNGDIVPVSVKEGDKVLLPEYGGTSVKLEDSEYVCWEMAYIIFRDEELLGVLKD